MEFNHLLQRGRLIRDLCRDYEIRRYGTPWTRTELALGFVGDVGDLAKLVMACDGRRAIPEAQTKLAHELSDCLWSIMALADAHGIDLETAFLNTMDELETHLKTTPPAG